MIHVEHSPILIAAVSLTLGAGLGFFLCALFTGSSAESMLDDIERLEDERDFWRERYTQLTDRDARGRFVRGEGTAQ